MTHTELKCTGCSSEESPVTRACSHCGLPLPNVEDPQPVSGAVHGAGPYGDSEEGPDETLRLVACQRALRLNPDDAAVRYNLAEAYTNDVVLDDEGGGGPIETFCGDPGDQMAPTSPPNYTPNDPLSAFDGEDIRGTWALTVRNRLPTVVGGTLVERCLNWTALDPANWPGTTAAD